MNAIGCERVGNDLNIDMEELKKMALPLTEYVNKMDPYLSVTVRQGNIIVSRDEMVVNTIVPD